jgi:hypothetical protein
MPEAPVSCEPFTCRGGQCLSSCSATEDCAGETFCDAGMCVTPTKGCGCRAIDLPLFAVLMLLLRRGRKPDLRTTATA